MNTPPRLSFDIVSLISLYRPLLMYRCRQMSDRCAAVIGSPGQLDGECQLYCLANAILRLIGAIREKLSGSGHAPVAAVWQQVLVIALQ